MGGYKIPKISFVLAYLYKKNITGYALYFFLFWKSYLENSR